MTQSDIQPFSNWKYSRLVKTIKWLEANVDFSTKSKTGVEEFLEEMKTELQNRKANDMMRKLIKLLITLGIVAYPALIVIGIIEVYSNNLPPTFQYFWSAFLLCNRDGFIAIIAIVILMPLISVWWEWFSDD